MPKIRVLPHKNSIEISEGKTIQEATDGKDVGILYGCRSGRCGSCVVRVVENPENLSPIEKRSASFLKIFLLRLRKGWLAKLACWEIARWKGPVRFCFP